MTNTLGFFASLYQPTSPGRPFQVNSDAPIGVLSAICGTERLRINAPMCVMTKRFPIHPFAHLPFARVRILTWDLSEDQGDRKARENRPFVSRSAESGRQSQLLSTHFPSEGRKCRALERLDFGAHLRKGHGSDALCQWEGAGSCMEAVDALNAQGPLSCLPGARESRCRGQDRVPEPHQPGNRSRPRRHRGPSRCFGGSDRRTAACGPSMIPGPNSRISPASTNPRLPPGRGPTSFRRDLPAWRERYRCDGGPSSNPRLRGDKCW